MQDSARRIAVGVDGSLVARSAVLWAAREAGLRRASHGALGPVEDRVAVHAHCPMVVVSRPPNSGQERTREVVVGWIDAMSAWWAFEAAVAAAEVRQASLTVLRVMPINQHTNEAWVGDRPLLEAISGHQPPCPPNLYIRISHEVTDDPADALVRAADGADLLVIGCHHSDDRWSVRTCPVTEAVMRGATCPVMLVSQPVHWEAVSVHASPAAAKH
jgi:nucleotide-binding universal stress UspA family protein